MNRLRARLSTRSRARAQQAEAAAADARRALDAAGVLADGLRADLDANAAAADALRDELAARDAEVERLQRELGAGQATADGLHDELAEAKTALDRERATARKLRGEADDVRASLSAQQEVATEAARELEQAQGELRAALDTVSGHQRQIDELNHGLQQERARGVAVEADLAAQRDMVAELTRTRTALQQELMDVRAAANSRAASDDTERATVAALERRCAELDEACTAALDLASEAVKERDAVSEQFEAERKRSADALAAAQTRLKEIDQELAEAERARQEAETEADEANSERDDLALLLDKAKQSVQGMNAAVEERLAAIDAKRARALKSAEERAEAAIRDRDALAAELAAVTRAASEAKEAKMTLKTPKSPKMRVTWRRASRPPPSEFARSSWSCSSGSAVRSTRTWNWSRYSQPPPRTCRAWRDRLRGATDSSRFGRCRSIVSRR